MRNDEHDELWGDILSEVAPTEFREALLDQTLSQVRRRKRTRRLGQGAMVVALVMIAGLLLWPRGTKQIVRVQQPKLESSGVEMVSSRPSVSSMMVQSVSGGVELISSEPAEMTFVDTKASQQGVRSISDEELLALLGNQPAALVRKGPHDAELLIVDARGQNIVTAGEGEAKQ